MKKKTFHILTLCFLLVCTFGILIANQVVAVFAIDNKVQEINVVDSGAEIKTDSVIITLTTEKNK